MPDWAAEIRKRLERVRLDPAREAEIVDEMAMHLEQRFLELRARGTPEADARRAVLDELSDGDSLARDLRGVERRAQPEPVPLGARSAGGLLGHLRQDLRYALRMLRMQPGFAAITVLTLALGIGATTAIFSVVNGVLLRSLPYREPDRLYAFHLSAPEKGMLRVPIPDPLFAFLRERSKAFSEMTAYTGAGFNLTGSGEPERLTGTNVTVEFFRLLGASPMLGRTFHPEEEKPENNLVTILSYSLWQRRFGGDPGIVGTAINLNGLPTVVVGVMPSGFEFPARTELWVPLGLDLEAFDSWYLSPLGRLAPGVSDTAAEREIAAIFDQYREAYAEQFRHADETPARAVADPLLERIVGDVRRPLVVLLGAVGLVLLIACANIANLLLARAAARTREIALRCCVGASPRRIAAQLFTESLVLALAGGAAGLLLAWGALRLLKHLPPGQLPRMSQVSLDPVVLAFTLGVTLLTGVLFGVAPAVRAARVNLNDALKERARGSASASGRRLNDSFVIVQFALCLVLLVGAGLLLRSFQRLLAVDPGFRPEHVLTARVQLPWGTYDDSVKVRDFYGRLLDNVRALPGIRLAGAGQHVPFSGSNPQNEFVIEGKEPLPGEPIPVASSRRVTPGFFEALGTPILAGRGFLDTDTWSTPLVVVVDETVASRFWPGVSALGKRLREGGDPEHSPWMTVVGVVPSVKTFALDDEASFYMYLPYAQQPHRSMTIVLRTVGRPEAATAALREQVAKLDPNLPIFAVTTMEQAVARSLGTRQLTNALLAGFALLAMLLAAVGIYGVMSLNVSARVREFGVRLALGAEPGDVSRLVLRQGMLLALAGVAVGLLGASWLTRFLRGLLFGIRPFDPVTFIAVAIALTGVALLACYLPARRATRADPISALRQE